jgi:hypothetical protein
VITPLAPIAPIARITPIATAPQLAFGPENRNLVIAQILEAGDRTDLAWLAATVGREGIAAFVRERGGRKLSARSRRFWSRALALAEPERPALAEQLWPLA